MRKLEENPGFQAFWLCAPPQVRIAMQVAASAVYLTGETALLLVRAVLPEAKLDAALFVSCLRACDFSIEMNDDEFYIEERARRHGLRALRENPELWQTAHSTLLRLRLTEKIDLPSYLNKPVGLAYHTAALEPAKGLELYLQAVAPVHDGQQWLLGRLAEEQQEDGILPPTAIEPAFLRARTTMYEERWPDARAYLERVVSSKEDREEVRAASRWLREIRDRF